MMPILLCDKRWMLVAADFRMSTPGYAERWPIRGAVVHAVVLVFLGRRGVGRKGGGNMKASRRKKV